MKLILYYYLQTLVKDIFMPPSAYLNYNSQSKPIWVPQGRVRELAGRVRELAHTQQFLKLYVCQLQSCPMKQLAAELSHEAAAELSDEAATDVIWDKSYQFEFDLDYLGSCASWIFFFFNCLHFPSLWTFFF